MLEGKVALIIGGASGIGAAVARVAASEGARVIVGDRSLAQAEALASTLNEGAEAHQLDVADNDSVVEVLGQLEDRLGGVDCMFNSAAVWEMSGLLETTRASYERLFSINVAGLFFAQQAVAQSMIRRSKKGSIVNIASQAGRRGEADSAIYAASKACAISMTQSAAMALIGHGIRVNAIAPGCVDTPMWTKVDEAFAKRDNLPAGEKTRRVAQSIPIGRLAMPEEVAQGAVFLASDRASYIVGQTLNIDGGSVLS